MEGERIKEGSHSEGAACSAGTHCLTGCEANQRYAGLTRVRLIYSRAAAPSQGRVTTVQRCGTLLQAVGIRVRRLTFVSVSGRQRLAGGLSGPRSGTRWS